MCILLAARLAAGMEPSFIRLRHKAHTRQTGSHRCSRASLSGLFVLLGLHFASSQSAQPSAPPQPPPSPPPAPPPIPFQQASILSCAQLGWAFDATLNVCGSSSAGMGGCTHNSTWHEAESQCRQHGARLCTRQELVVNKNSGCGHDAEFVWVWESCNHNAATSAEYVCALEDATCSCTGTVYCTARTQTRKYSWYR